MNLGEYVPLNDLRSLVIHSTVTVIPIPCGLVDIVDVLRFQPFNVVLSIPKVFKVFGMFTNVKKEVYSLFYCEFFC